MGHFFSLKNSKFFSGLKKMPHSAVHYYLYDLDFGLEYNIFSFILNDFYI